MQYYYAHKSRKIDGVEREAKKRIRMGDNFAVTH